MNFIDIDGVKTALGDRYYYRIIVEAGTNKLAISTWCRSADKYKIKYPLRQLTSLPNYIILDDGISLTDHVAAALFDFTKLYPVAADTSTSIMEQL